MTNRTSILLVVGAAVVAVTTSASGQTAATRIVMREKLETTQRILQSVMTSDFARLERDSHTLSRLTERPGWMVLTTPEYVRYSGAFIAEVQALAEAAKDRDLDTAAVRYTSVTMACYQCHRYVKNARVASRQP